MKKLLMALCLMLSLSAHGQDTQSVAYFDGTSLMDDCESDRQQRQYSCVSYLMGMTDGFVGASNYAGFKVPYCKPAEVTGSQLRKIVVKHYNNHPEDLHYTAHSVVLILMQDSFPCAD